MIINILKKCGYKNIDSENIFVSCESESTKRSGELFEKVEKSNNIDTSKWIHIGDAVASV